MKKEREKISELIAWVKSDSSRGNLPNEALIEPLYELYMSGHSIANISEEVGRSRDTISRWFKNFGMTVYNYQQWVKIVGIETGNAKKHVCSTEQRKTIIRASIAALQRQALVKEICEKTGRPAYDVATELMGGC